MGIAGMVFLSSTMAVIGALLVIAAGEGHSVNEYMQALIVMGVFFCMEVMMVLYGKKLYEQSESYAEKRKLLPCTWLQLPLFIGILLIFFEVHAYTGFNMQTDPYVLIRRMSITMIAYVGISFFIIREGRVICRGFDVNRIVRGFTLNRKRRFVVAPTEVKEGKITGFVFGTIKENDTVYLVGPSGKPLESAIMQIQKDGNPVKQFSDGSVEITLQDHGEEKMHSDSIISGIQPIMSNKEINIVENPYLLAMIYAFSHRLSNNSGMNRLIYAICHAHYLTPVMMEKPRIGAEDIIRVIQSNANVRFMRVSANMKENDAALPVFTDWDAFRRYHTVMEEPEAKTLILSFPQCIDLMKQNYQGIVINPFGPQPFYLSSNFVKHIEELEGYQKDFKTERGKS